MRTTTRHLIALLFLVLSGAVCADTLKYEIDGVRGDMQSNAEASLKAVQELQGEPLTSDSIRTFYDLAPREIKKSLEPYGYFNAQIQGKLSRKGNAWLAQFNVAPGAPVRIGKVDVEVHGDGRNNEKVSEFLRHFPIKRGEVFNTEEYQKGKDRLLQTIVDLGYVRARIIENQIYLDRKKSFANIIITVETGKRYYFGTVTFESTVYNEPFLHRFVTIRPDQPFSSETLTRLQQELASSFYFQSVLVTPDFNNVENDHVPIHISVTPPKSQHYKLGVGYGTFTGPRLTAGMSLRRVTDTGQHFDAQLRLSQVVSGLAAKYYIPGKNPLTDQWVLGASYQKFEPENGSSLSKNLSVAYDKKTPKWHSNLSLNYLIDQYSLNDTPTRDSHLLYPSWNVSYLDVDDLINPRFGKSFNLILQGASSSLLSSTNFLQANFKAKYIFTPAEFARFIVRGELGYTAVQDLNKLPLSMRFFTGGSNSVRGYKESSIGPGKYLEVGSVEYQHHLFGNWTGAVFYDIGAASNTFNKGYNSGKGVGLVYSSVIGPVKLYVAKGDKFGFELNVGPEF